MAHSPGYHRDRRGTAPSRRSPMRGPRTVLSVLLIVAGVPACSSAEDGVGTDDGTGAPNTEAAGMTATSAGSGGYGGTGDTTGTGGTGGTTAKGGAAGTTSSAGAGGTTGKGGGQNMG